MIGVGFAPGWFTPYAAVSELLFLAVSVLVAILAFRVYKLSSSRLALSFGLGFSLLAIAHLLRTVFEFLSLASVVRCGGGFFSHCSLLAFTSSADMIAELAALGLIAYAALKPQRYEPALLLIALAVAPFLLAQQPVLAFGVVSMILLGYLTIVFALNARSRPSALSVLVALGFFFLFVSSIVVSLSTQYASLSVAATLLQLVGYGCILANYVLVLRR